MQYTVQAGDTLWTISERFYGTGFEFDRLVKANAGTRMPDGSRFTRTGVIQPRWTIDVPLPSRAIEEVRAALRSHLFGDPMRRNVGSVASRSASLRSS